MNITKHSEVLTKLSAIGVTFSTLPVAYSENSVIWTTPRVSYHGSTIAPEGICVSKDSDPEIIESLRVNLSCVEISIDAEPSGTDFTHIKSFKKHERHIEAIIALSIILEQLPEFADESESEKVRRETCAWNLETGGLVVYNTKGKIFIYDANMTQVQGLAIEGLAAKLNLEIIAPESSD